MQVNIELLNLLRLLDQKSVPTLDKVCSMFSNLDDELRSLDYQHEEVIAEAIGTFARDKELLHMSPEQNLLFWLRVNYASDFVQGLVAAPHQLIAQPKGQREKIICWLLADVWEHAGFGTIHGLIEEMVKAWPPGSRAISKN